MTPTWAVLMSKAVDPVGQVHHRGVPDPPARTVDERGERITGREEVVHRAQFG
ncbi:hypothetical protein [Streptomyces sp. NPDC048637]|uniref:hypothetical protein n=1 Tax=Streptomyces sp. NPDC048637 TaxID=3155636 RepID=UPI00344A7BCE